MVVKSWPELVNNKLEASASKYKFWARAVKHKFGARAGKRKFGARAGKYKSGARDQAKAGGGGPQTCNLIKKETPAQVFSREFFEISKSTFFTEHLWTTASVL